MIYFIIAISILIIIAIFLLVISLFWEKSLCVQKIFCFIFDHKSYVEYMRVIDYNKIFNRTIPIYDDWTTYNKELMEDRYYIMNGGLWFDNDCLGMKYLKLMMQDLIRRNSIELN